MLVAAYNENFQSRFVCQRILELREEGVPLPEIAVLFRSSFHSFDLELELTRHDIPFVKRGGFQFIETAHVKDALAHLRVLANPRDAVSWHRILLLLEGVGPRTAEDIIGRLVGAADVPAALEEISGRSYSTDLQALAGLFRRIGDGGRAPRSSSPRSCATTSPCSSAFTATTTRSACKDLEHFVAIAARYADLQSLLTDMALEPPSDSVGDVLAADEDERDCSPCRPSTPPRGWSGTRSSSSGRSTASSPRCTACNQAEELEEERRLMYVAATRAKQNLYITYPINMYDRAAGMVLSKPSRFLDDIPSQMLRPVRLVEEG